MILLAHAYADMNINNLFLHVFKPALAARMAAEARMVAAPGCEQRPLAALIKRVENAESLRGLVVTSPAAQRLASHVAKTHALTPRQIMNHARALKHEQQDVLRDLMQRSAGARGGSAHARQIAATREVVQAVRHLSWEVRVAPAPAQQGNA